MVNNENPKQVSIHDVLSNIHHRLQQVNDNLENSLKHLHGTGGDCSESNTASFPSLRSKLSDIERVVRYIEDNAAAIKEEIGVAEPTPALKSRVNSL